jgi:hypothetical protein
MRLCPTPQIPYSPASSGIHPCATKVISWFLAESGRFDTFHFLALEDSPVGFLISVLALSVDPPYTLHSFTTCFS